MKRLNLMDIATLVLGTMTGRDVKKNRPKYGKIHTKHPGSKRKPGTSGKTKRARQAERSMKQRARRVEKRSHQHRQAVRRAADRYGKR